MIFFISGGKFFLLTLREIPGCQVHVGDKFVCGVVAVRKDVMPFSSWPKEILEHLEVSTLEVSRSGLCLLPEVAGDIDDIPGGAVTQTECLDVVLLWLSNIVLLVLLATFPSNQHLNINRYILKRVERVLRRTMLRKSSIFSLDCDSTSEAWSIV